MARTGGSACDVLPLSSDEPSKDCFKHTQMSILTNLHAYPLAVESRKDPRRSPSAFLQLSPSLLLITKKTFAFTC